VAENTFGILAQKWKLYYRPIEGRDRKKYKGYMRILYKYLRAKTCDDKYYEYLELAERVMGALNNLRNNPTSVNMSIRIRERFVVFFNK
jgi:hypothetical protein